MLNKNYIKIWNGKEIIEKYKNNQILIPRYQRSFVWKTEKQKDFIDSLQNGWPVGVIIIHEKDEKYYIMDGLQRTTTLAKYTSDWEIHPEITSDSFLNRITNQYKNEVGNHYLEDVFDSIKLNFEEIVLSYKAKLKNDSEYFYKTNSDKRIKNILNDVFFGKTSNVTFYIKKYLKYFDNELQDALKKIDQYRILIHIWNGNYEDAPKLFRRVNEQGEKLSKLILIASEWSSEISIKWESKSFEKDFKKINEKRFESLLDVGILTKEQIEGQGKQQTFGALEIIYFIADKIYESIKNKDFKKFLLKNKTKDNVELNLESFVVLIKTYLKVKKNIQSLKTEDLDEQIKENLSSEIEIKEIIEDISFYIEYIIEKIKFIVDYDKNNDFSETEKNIAKKTMFWTYLFALGIKDQNKSSNSQIYSFLINKFSTEPTLVKTGDHFDKLDFKIFNNEFFDNFDYANFVSEKQKFFKKDFFSKTKKKTKWERMFIIKILYLKFLYKTNELKNLELLPYFKDKDFDKGHVDEKNYNIYPNFGFFSKDTKGKQKLQKDTLLSKDKNLWLKERFEEEGKLLVDKINDAYEKFYLAKDIKDHSSMNQNLEEFLENRMMLINKTIIHYLKEKK